MMSASRAVSTTSRLIVVMALISRMRVICAKRRWTRRKLPLVIRATALIASASVKSPAESVSPIAAQWCSRTNVSSSAERAVFVREADAGVQLWVAREAAFDAGHADQDQADAGAVVVIAQLLEARVFRRSASSTISSSTSRWPDVPTFESLKLLSAISNSISQPRRSWRVRTSLSTIRGVLWTFGV